MYWEMATVKETEMAAMFNFQQAGIPTGSFLSLPCEIVGRLGGRNCGSGNVVERRMLDILTK
jgi:hypothetical protein